MHYYGPGCLDEFYGLIELSDHMKTMCEEEKFVFKRWLKEILSEAFFALSSWDDQKTPLIYVGILPSTYLIDLKLFLIWKQSDNGLTFMASPFNIDGFKHKDGAKRITAENIDNCHDLINRIMNEIS